MSSILITLKINMATTQDYYSLMLLVYCTNAVSLSHNEYKGVLLNQNCLRHSMNRIQSKSHRIRNYEINRISLSYFDDKMHILKMDIMDYPWLLELIVKKQVS